MISYLPLINFITLQHYNGLLRFGSKINGPALSSTISIRSVVVSRRFLNLSLFCLEFKERKKPIPT